MAVEKDGSASTQSYESISFQKLLNRAQVLLGINMIVIQLERTVTTETNAEESLVINGSTESTVFIMIKYPYNWQHRGNYKAQEFHEINMTCLRNTRMLVLQQ